MVYKVNEIVIIFILKIKQKCWVPIATDDCNIVTVYINGFIIMRAGCSWKSFETGVGICISSLGCVSGRTKVLNVGLRNKATMQERQRAGIIYIYTQRVMREQTHKERRNRGKMK